MDDGTTDGLKLNLYVQFETRYSKKHPDRSGLLIVRKMRLS